MTEIFSTSKHYDNLIDLNNDPFLDPPELQKYMEKWTSNVFWDIIGNTKELDVFEIGVGTGRMVKYFIEKGFKSFTGIDISSKTIERAKSNLSSYSKINLIKGDICDFELMSKFDLAFSVLTFMHISQRESAYKNIFSCLKNNGKFVCSFSTQKKWLNWDKYKVKLYPFNENNDLTLMKEVGFDIINQKYLFEEDNKLISVIIEGVKKIG